MSGRMKKIIYWCVLCLLMMFGPALNLMMDKEIALNDAIERMLVGPLPVKAYLILLAMLTFVCGELVLAALQTRNIRWSLWSCLVLLMGWGLTKYHYFLLLALFSLGGTLTAFILERRKQDAIHEVLETVMSAKLDTEEEEAEEMIEENEEPEISVEPETALDDLQRQEIELFLDSLFEKSTLPSVAEEPLEEPFAREILSDANELLEIETETETEEVIKKEPPKKVVLEKIKVQPSDDLLEAELSKKEEPLGEFDEEIPLDDFVE